MRTILVFPGDEHSGSTTGLMRPQQWQLENGGFYDPSPLQKLIWQQYAECWQYVADLRKEKKSRIIITEMSDPVDGVHHSTTELVTHNVGEMERMFIDCLDYGMQAVKFSAKRGDVLQFLSGTEAHTGVASRSVENVARDMEARPKRKPSEPDGRDGKFVFERLIFKVGAHMFDVAHTGMGVGKRIWARENGITLAIRDIYLTSLEYGTAIPRYVIRAHRHSHASAMHTGKRGVVEGIVTPAFQFRSSYGYQVTNSGMGMDSIGMLVVVVEDDGSTWWRCPMLEVVSSRGVEEI